MDLVRSLFSSVPIGKELEKKIICEVIWRELTEKLKLHELYYYAGALQRGLIQYSVSGRYIYLMRVNFFVKTVFPAFNLYIYIPEARLPALNITS